MAVTTTAFGPFGKHLLDALIAAGDPNVKVTLHDSSFTPTEDMEFFSSATGEVAGTNYTAGGQAIAALASSYDATNHRSVLTGNNVVWSNLTATYRYAVVRYDTGSAATSPLLFWVDFGTDQNASGVDTTLAWDSTGLYRLSV
jgi:hypothetical protein